MKCKRLHSGLKVLSKSSAESAAGAARETLLADPFPAETPAWWKESTVYQIYPKSFYDSTGNGKGDLPGILLKLDYIQSLGVDVLWLNPVYQSPWKDNGYDISGYRRILPELGTMDDMDTLIRGVHARGMRIIMDLVVNHTSDQHPWFQKSRLTPQSPEAEYYWWRPGTPEQPPNRWQSFFGGPAWSWDETREAWYLHLFSPHQPDLNWENPTLRREIYAMMAWWLDKGIDGFRMDVINFISKNPTLPEGNPPEDGRPFFVNGPRIHEFLQEMHREVLDGRDILTVGECSGASTADAVLYTDPARKELNQIFGMDLMEIDYSPRGKWSPRPWSYQEMKTILTRWQLSLEGRGWNTLFLSNHDQPRGLSRFGESAGLRQDSAKMLITLIHSLKGTPYFLQGEELGLPNPAYPRLEQYRDIESLNFIRQARAEGWDKSKILHALQNQSRDNGRSPMPWHSRDSRGGFTQGEPWIDPHPSFGEINVEQEEKDPASVLAWFRHLTALRKREKGLIYGQFYPAEGGDRRIFRFLRLSTEEQYEIVLNLSGETVPLPQAVTIGWQTKTLLLQNPRQNGETPEEQSGEQSGEQPQEQRSPNALITTVFRPYEVRIYKRTT